MRIVLPSVVSYLARLPDGVDSHPTALVKGSVVRVALRPEITAADWTGVDVPGSVRDLVQHPPSVSAWVPEAHYCALLEAIYDRWFATAEGGGMPAYDAWLLAGARTLMRSPIYRALFFVAGVQRIVTAGADRWGMFHRGSSLELLTRGPGSSELRIHFPPYLFGPSPLLAVEVGVRSSVEAAGGNDVVTECRVEGPASAYYRVTWS